MGDKDTNDVSIEKERRRFLKEAARLWPVAKGSIAEVRRPCAYKGCRACARGEKHPGINFMVTDHGKRRCFHVPKGKADEVRKAIEGGKRLQELITEAGILLLRSYSHKKPRPEKGLR